MRRARPGRVMVMLRPRIVQDGVHQDGQQQHGGHPAAEAAPAVVVTAVVVSPEHRGLYRKTPTMPDARAITVSPASTHGMPAAPSAARDERFRRPTAIIAPQAIRPKMPAMNDPHFHQAASGAGSGTPPASGTTRIVSACRASAWISTVCSLKADRRDRSRSVAGAAVQLRAGLGARDVLSGLA